MGKSTIKALKGKLKKKMALQKSVQKILQRLDLQIADLKKQIKRLEKEDDI